MFKNAFFQKKISEVHLENDRRITLVTDILLKYIKSFLFPCIKKKIECFTSLITLQNIHLQWTNRRSPKLNDYS